MAITTVEIECDYCGTKFDRTPADIRTTEKRKLKNTFCSHKCDAQYRQSLIPDHMRFHIYIGRASRRKNVECTIDTHYLLQLWNEQNGICPLTGWKLILQSRASEKKGVTMYHASLDRIDSSKGYVKGNVRFVSIMANYAKHQWGDKDLKEFCKAVTNN